MAILNHKKRYIQIALNSTLAEALEIIRQLPASDRILIEAGTPLIKTYGYSGIRQIRDAWNRKLQNSKIFPYVVADLKIMDRAITEVSIAKQAGASAAICLGQAPIETINSFVETCKEYKIDSMLDMMNIDQPINILRKIKKMPDVIMLHRGVDEEYFNKAKPIPYIQINKILSSYNVLISIAGGDTAREVQRAVFNGANIVVVWKEFFHSNQQTANLAHEFLKEIK